MKIPVLGLNKMTFLTLHFFPFIHSPNSLHLVPAYKCNQVHAMKELDVKHIFTTVQMFTLSLCYQIHNTDLGITSIIRKVSSVDT